MIYQDKDWLIEKYITQEMTLEEIGREVGVSLHTIRKWMCRHGIERRNASRLDEHVGRKIIDIAGNRFGRLVAVEYADKSSEGRTWLCVCDCGKEKIIPYRRLQSGNTRSCGCLAKETRDANAKKWGGQNKKNYGEARFNDLFLGYKRRAKKRRLPFDLTKEQFRKLTKDNCYYCGIEPQQIISAGRDVYGEYVYNGIDRIDSKAGYTIENTRTCCKFCNVAKSTMSEDEFFIWLRRVVNHLDKYWKWY